MQNLCAIPRYLLIVTTDVFHVFNPGVLTAHSSDGKFYSQGSGSIWVPSPGCSGYGHLLTLTVEIILLCPKMAIKLKNGPEIFVEVYSVTVQLGANLA